MTTSFHRGRIFANVSLQGVAIVALFLMVNYLGFNHFRRWDFSRDQKYSLSEQTRNIVAGLEKPLRMTVFFSEAPGITFDTVALAKEYANASGQKIALEVVNPYLHLSRAREIATEYKLGDQENVVILDYDGRTKFVNAMEMAEYDPPLNPLDAPRLRAFKGEQALTSAIVSVMETETPPIYVVTGHGEADLLQSEAYLGLRTFVERQNLKLLPLALAGETPVPDDARAVIIVGPRYDYGEAALAQLRAYWQRKGRLFLALEAGHATPNLDLWLHESGVTPRQDRVLQIVPLGQKLAGVRKEITGDFVPGSPITQGLNQVHAVLMGTTQSLVLEPERVAPAKIRLYPLIRASEGFWGEIRYDPEAPGGIFFDANEDVARPFVAASAELGAAADERVQVATSRMVVIGNTTFLQNDAMTAADLDFVLNSLNWLLAREPMIGITPKDARDFTLSLTSNQLGTLGMGVVGGIPALAALIGLIVWLKRRR